MFLITAAGKALEVSRIRVIRVRIFDERPNEPPLYNVVAHVDGEDPRYPYIVCNVDDELQGMNKIKQILITVKEAERVGSPYLDIREVE